MGQLIINDIEKVPAAGRNVIEEITRAAGAEPNYVMKTDIDYLLDAVQKVFHCTLDELKSNSKKRDLPYARRIVFFYAKKIYPNHPDRKIGELLNRSQSDVSYCIRMVKIQNSRQKNHVFYQYVHEVERLLRGRWFMEL